MLLFFYMQPAEEELEKDVIDQLVWPTENLARNAFIRINMYKDTVLRPLEVSYEGLTH